MCCLVMSFTQTLIWTLLLPYRGILHVTFVKKVLSKRYTFVALFGIVWSSVHLPCHGYVSQDDLWSMLKEMEDVVINLRRRHRTSRIVIGSVLNMSGSKSGRVDRFPYSFKCKWCIISLA